MATQTKWEGTAPTAPLPNVTGFDSSATLLYAKAISPSTRTKSEWADVRHGPSSTARWRLTATLPSGDVTLTGQVAKALAALVRAGAAGVTALEVSSWAYRLGAYVHTLRREFGLAIETVREPHEGGWHGRYVLHSPVVLAEPTR
jgi:hypothetical protein